MEKTNDMNRAEILRDLSAVFSEIADSYLYSHLAPGSIERLTFADKPMKLDGTLVLVVCSGTPFEIEVNLERYTVRPGTLLTCLPTMTMKTVDPLPSDIDAHLLYFNMSFLQNININLSAVTIPPMLRKPEPISQLEPDEISLMLKYMELLHLNTFDNTNLQINRSIASSLIAAMFYQMVQFYHKRIAGMIDYEGTTPIGRRHDYVREFVKLVHLHFIRERSVSFYADKLFISPKYLSLLVREATGRSAAKWIDDFVLMEAKNMLRFSGKNIQQVAYALNFPTQSSFGKYFKHLTGMSPTEYQKS